jgi:hypothetical protein
MQGAKDIPQGKGGRALDRSPQASVPPRGGHGRYSCSPAARRASATEA